MSKDSFFKRLQTKKAGIYILFPPLFVTLGTIFLFIAAQVFGVLLFSIVLGLLGNNPEQISDLYSENVAMRFALSFVISLLTIGLVIWLLRFSNIKPLQYMKIGKTPVKNLLKQTLKAYGLYFISFIFIATAGSLLVPSLDVDQQQQLGFDSVQGIGLLLAFLSLVVLPPITEEVLFRGFLYNTLSRVTARRVAIIITSLLFAAAHLEFLGENPLNFIAALDTFVLSLFLIWVYEKTNSLWAPILLHGLKNLIAFVVLFVI